MRVEAVVPMPEGLWRQRCVGADSNNAQVAEADLELVKVVLLFQSR